MSLFPVQFFHHLIFSFLFQGIASRATASVRMPVANLVDTSPRLTHDNMVELLAEAYDNRVDASRIGVCIIIFSC